MARLRYADAHDPALHSLVEQIIAARGEVLHLYRMLLHSPPVAEGWLQFLTAIRAATTLPATVRELIIIRVAVLNRAPYEAEQHRPNALAAGVTPAQIAALDDWQQEAHLFNETEQSALALTDQMTQHVQVDDAVWQQVELRWNEREIVELVATIASYNMVSRFLSALDIHAPADAKC